MLSAWLLASDESVSVVEPTILSDSVKLIFVVNELLSVVILLSSATLSLISPAEDVTGIVSVEALRLDESEYLPNTSEVCCKNLTEAPTYSNWNC